MQQLKLWFQKWQFQFKAIGAGKAIMSSCEASHLFFHLNLEFLWFSRLPSKAVTKLQEEQMATWNMSIECYGCNLGSSCNLENQLQCFNLFTSNAASCQSVAWWPASIWSPFGYNMENCQRAGVFAEKNIHIHIHTSFISSEGIRGMKSFPVKKQINMKSSISLSMSCLQPGIVISSSTYSLRTHMLRNCNSVNGVIRIVRMRTFQ